MDIQRSFDAICEAYKAGMHVNERMPVLHAWRAMCMANNTECLIESSEYFADNLEVFHASFNNNFELLFESGGDSNEDRCWKFCVDVVSIEHLVDNTVNSFNSYEEAYMHILKNIARDFGLTAPEYLTKRIQIHYNEHYVKRNNFRERSMNVERGAHLVWTSDEMFEVLMRDLNDMNVNSYSIHKEKKLCVIH